MVNTLDSAFKSEEEMNLTPTRKDRTKVTLVSLIHHEPVNIPLCEDCNHDQEEKGHTCKNKEYKDCTATFENLDNV